MDDLRVHCLRVEVLVNILEGRDGRELDLEPATEGADPPQGGKATHEDGEFVAVGNHLHRVDGLGIERGEHAS